MKSLLLALILIPVLALGTGSLDGYSTNVLFKNFTKNKLHGAIIESECAASFAPFVGLPPRRANYSDFQIFKGVRTDVCSGDDKKIRYHFHRDAYSDFVIFDIWFQYERDAKIIRIDIIDNYNLNAELASDDYSNIIELFEILN